MRTNIYVCNVHVRALNLNKRQMMYGVLNLCHRTVNIFTLFNAHTFKLSRFLFFIHSIICSLILLETSSRNKSVWLSIHQIDRECVCVCLKFRITSKLPKTQCSLWFWYSASSKGRFNIKSIRFFRSFLVLFY